MNPLLEGRDPRLVRADLADDAGPHAPIPRTGNPLLQLPHELVGEVVDRATIDQRLGRVVGAAIPAAAHHDVEPGRLREPAKPPGIASEARRGDIRERRPTEIAKPLELGPDDLEVARELPVVPAIGDVPERDGRVLVREREAESSGLDRPEHRLDVWHRAGVYAPGHRVS